MGYSPGSHKRIGHDLATKKQRQQHIKKFMLQFLPDCMHVQSLKVLYFFTVNCNPLSIELYLNLSPHSDGRPKSVVIHLTNLNCHHFSNDLSFLPTDSSQCHFSLIVNMPSPSPQVRSLS